MEIKSGMMVMDRHNPYNMQLMKVVHVGVNGNLDVEVNDHCDIITTTSDDVIIATENAIKFRMECIRRALDVV